MAKEALNKLLNTIENNDGTDKEIFELTEIAFNLAEKNIIDNVDKEKLFRIVKKKAYLENIPPNTYNMEDLYIYKLFKMYKKGIGTKRNSEEALNCLIKMVEEGSVNAAAREIVFIYRDGDKELSIKPNREKMISWCFKTAEYNCPASLYYLALKAMGKKVPPIYDLRIDKSLPLAIKCLEILTTDENNTWKIYRDFSHIIARNVPFYDLSDDVPYKFKLLFNGALNEELSHYTNYNRISEHTAKLSHLLSLLGTVYLELKDYKRAIKTFKEAILNNSLLATINLSEMYQHGVGITKNKKKAFELKKKIADSVICDNSEFIIDLPVEEEYKILKTIEEVAKSYRYGIGVKKSLPEALKYYTELQKISMDIFMFFSVNTDFQETLIHNNSKAIHEINKLLIVPTKKTEQNDI